MFTKKTLFVSMLILVLSVALIFATGKKETGATGMTGAADGEPQYGGKLTYLYWATGSPGIPSLGNVGAPEWLFIAPTMEYMAMGDIEKYGPRGSDEYPFSYHTYTPVKWMKGALAESWEISLDKLIIHIRPGVYFTGVSINPVMERREYTADDYVNNLKLIAFGEGAAGVLLRTVDMVEDVYAEDKYTAVVELKRYHPEWYFWLWGWYETEQYPKELSAEARQDWKNLVGTGPWMLTEWVPGSHMGYERNPDYWRTTTIDGKEYEIPFADELVMPFILDDAAAVSALRTGKLDVYNFVGPEYMESLDKSRPDLLKRPSTYGNVNVLFLKCDQPPFNNRNVRRALMIGTDRQSIHEAVVRLGPTYTWPCAAGTDGFIPLEDLPEESRLLFDYNPELAKQMLRDEGIPEGFKMKIYLEIRPDITGTIEMIAGMWQKDLGIEVEIVPEESVAFESRRDARNYEDAMCSDGNTLLSYTGLEGFCGTGGFRNFSNYSNKAYDQLLEEAAVTVDPVKYGGILEELFKIAIDDVPMIPMSMPSMNSYWWPWVKNYWGEPGSVVADPPTAQMWIDQNLKAEMGY